MAGTVRESAIDRAERVAAEFAELWALLDRLREQRADALGEQKPTLTLIRGGIDEKAGA